MSSGGSRSMRAARTAWTVAGTWMVCDRPRQAIRAALAREHLRLDQRADALLEEERVALGPLDQERLERARARVRPRASASSSSSALSAGADRAGAACSRSCCPRRAGTRAGSSRAGAAAPSGRLSTRLSRNAWRLGVDPVQVLEDQEERLHLALPQEQALDGLERALAPLGGSSACHCGSSRARRAARGRRERAAPRAASSVSSLPVTFSRILRASSPALDLEVGLEQVDHRQVASSPSRRRPSPLSRTSQPCVRWE